MNYRREQVFQFDCGLRLHVSNKMFLKDLIIQFYRIYSTFKFYNLMTLLQKLINLVAIVACTALLGYLHSSFKEISAEQNEVIYLVEQIGIGNGLKNGEEARIGELVAKGQKNAVISGIVCFLKAYDELVLKSKLDPETIFHIFESGKEFSGVSNCTHYYSLLLYRASQIQNKQKVKILGKLNELLGQQIKTGSQTPICTYFYAYNSEITVKDQTASIIQQQYGSHSGVVDIDGATDNTKMFVKYTLDEYKGKSQKIDINSQSQRKGFINNFESIVEKQCPSNSIVVVLDKNSILLSSNSFKIINNHFTSTDKEIAIFKSLTIRHENIENNDISNFPQIYPVLVFRKSVFKQFKQILNKVSQVTKEKSELLNYQHQLFIYNLMKDPSLSSKISISNEAILYRQALTTAEQSILSVLIEK